MKKRAIKEFIHEGKFKIWFNGFFDYKHFEKAINVYTKDIGAVCINSSMGFFDSASCVTLLEGIELQWYFDNWVCIELSYQNANDNKAIEKIKLWAEKIFGKLIEEFGEYYID